MSSRGFHSKTRHGCYVCKQRRKKCGLEQPTCVNCRRLGLQCHYLHILSFGPGQTQRHSVTDPSATLYAPQLHNTLHSALQTQPSHSKIVDFELATHFLRRPKEFCAIPGLKAISQLDLQTQARRYPYLIHGLLSFSALYIASTTVQQTNKGPSYYHVRARQHQHIATLAYMRCLGDISGSSCHFIFGFSLVLACIQLAFLTTSSFNIGDEKEVGQVIADVVDIFELMQGTVTIATQVRAWLPNRRPDSVLLPAQDLLYNESPTVPVEIESAFQGLTTYIGCLRREHRLGSATSSTCLSAAIQLRNVFTHLYGSEYTKIKALIAWLAFVDRSFVALLRTRHLTAMVVLAYFATALQCLDHLWWLRGLGIKLTHAIELELRRYGLQEWRSAQYHAQAVISQRRTHESRTADNPANEPRLEEPERQTRKCVDRPPDVGFDAAFDSTYLRGFSNS